MPEGFKVEEAVGGGDCFFDSVAQGLKRLNPEMDFTVKELRKVCKELAVNNQQLRDKVIRDAKNIHDSTVVLPDSSISDDELWNAYLASIEYTVEDMDRISSRDPSLYKSLTSLKYGSTLQVPIWGRPDIEGQLICNEYHIKLHIIEKSPYVGYLNQVLDGSVSRSVDSVDYNDISAIHIVNEGKAHFKPILYTQRIQHKRQSPDIDSDDEREKNTELFSAIKNDNMQKVQELLKAGVKVSIIDKNNKDNTPLHYAIEREKKEIAAELLQEWKADINVQNNKGDTPLHIATSKGNKELVQLLVSNKAKTDIKNNEDRTPLDTAKHLKRQDIVEVLESHIQLNLKASVEEQSASQQQSQQKRTKTDSKEDKLEDRISILDGKNTYDASGLKHTLHGNVYQLKLLMLFLKRGLNKSCYFRLATEMDAAEKFDDLVFQYENERKDGKVYRFLQAKHKQDESKKIAVNNLLTEKDEDFSLQKYFLSYRKIKQNPEFYDQSNELKDFVICTNIDLGDDLQNSFERLEDEDDIISIKVGNDSKEPKRLKFKEGGPLTKETLTSRLVEVSDLKRLAKKLAEYVFGNNNKTIGLKDDLFKKYHGALAERVIDIQTKKFKEDFVSGSSNLPKEVKEFREVLLEKSGLSEEDFKRKLETKNLKISDKFGNVLNIEENPQINRKKTSNNSPDPSQELAEHIANLIVNGNIGTPIKIEQRANIIKENIAKLIGHVFVETEDGGKKEFRQGFLNGDELPGNLNDFRKGLKTGLSKGIQFSQLDQYQFEISVHTCTEEGYKEYKKKGQDYFKLPIPNDKVSNEEIDDFLDKLVFAVNQPNEVELGNIIEAEMGEEKDINLIDSELIASKFQKDMLDWMKEKKGRFLSYKDGENFFKEAKQKLSKLVLIGPTLEYRAKIEDFGIAFSKEPSGLSDFLASHERQIFNLVNPHETILSSIKVCQTLKGIPNYQKDDSHIFIRLSSLLRIQDRAIEAFKSNDLLIIECDYTNKAEPNQDVRSLAEDVQRLYSSLKSKLNGNKKIILITKENDLLANKFKSALRDKYQEKKDERNSLTDLTPESQVKLLKRGKVTFQGEEVSLGRLVDNGSKHLLDGEVLSNLVTNKKIEIGKALTDSKYEDIKNYYIPRTFNRQVKIKKSLKKENSVFLVTDNSQIDEKNLKKKGDIALISDTGESFKELCNKYEKYNIHWLKQKRGDLIWKKSYGTLSKLRKFVDTNAQAIQEYKPEKITDIKDRVVIISAEPGMGKSTVLTPLALKTKDSLWVIRINLLDYSTALKIETEKKTKLNEAEAIKFLYRIVGFQLFQGEKEETTEKKGKREQTVENVLRAITVKDSEVSLEGAGEEIKGLKLLEIRLFNNFYNQGKIVLLFDGLDEISPDYTEKVIELLQVLENSKVEKLWITTRPYNFIQERLEDQLSVFSYSLKPLLLEEHKGFLRKFWKAKLKLNELDEQRSGVFIDELLGKLPKSIGDKDFMSIPLHAFMVAEVFKDAFKSFYDSNEKELSDEHKRKIEEQDLVTLYERFINIKFHEIHFGEKRPGANTDDPYIKGMFEKEHKEFIEDHMKLALYAIFNEDKVKELLSQEEIEKVTKLIVEIKQGKEKAGITDRLINDKPRFVHRTFAEYFAAGLLANMVQRKKSNPTKYEQATSFLKEHIFPENNRRILEFFDLILSKELPLHRAVLNNDGDKVKELLSDPQKVEKVINSIDKGGRTALHLAAEYGYSDIVQKLLDRGADVTIVDGIFGWYPFIYADSNYHVDEAISILKVVEKVKVKGYYLNLLNVYYKFQDYLPQSLHYEIISLFKVNYVGKQTLLCIAAKDGLLELTRFLLEQGADVNPDTDNRYTPLINAARKGHFEIVKALLEKGAYVNDDDGLGMTALHYAVRANEEEMVKFLIQNGADVDAINKKGNTPLHYACRNQDEDIRDFLIDHGANYITNNDDKGPEYYIEDEEFYRETDKLFKEKFSESDSQNPSSDEESHSPEEYHDSDDEIDSDDSGALLNYLLNKEPDPDSDLTPSNSDESDIESDSCLSINSRRRKREAVEECLFTWEDVDEFNEEKDEKRDFSKIKIDSEKFVSYIKDLPKEKQSQLIQLASEVKIGGSSQGLVSKLTGNQKVMNHLGRVGKISGMTMHGMMAKNVLADFLNGNYQGVAINVGFIAGGQGFAKVAEAASIKGLKLAEEGKLLVGQSLKAASPFLARATSAFVVYDLVNQIKSFKNGTEEALVGVVGDSIYLGVDAAEIGIEVAEGFGVLEGVSSVTGPIGATIGAVVFVGTDVYMAVKKVEKIDQIIHLTEHEKFIEGLRAFIGIKPEQYIEELMEKKQLYNQLVKQGLEYLKQHSDIQSYVFPTGKSVVDSCRKVPEEVNTYAIAGFTGAHLTFTRYTEKCTTKFEVDLDSKVLLDRKRTGIRWSRARPDDLNGGRVFCLPQGNDEPAPDYGSYLCENAIGIFANKTGNHTLINLGEGKDYAKGFLNSPNIFVVNNGSKEYYGGSKDDIFVLQAEYIKGHLSGEGGVNTLDTTLFALQEEQLNIQLEIGEIADYFRDNWLRVCEINKVIGRANKAETITVACDGCNNNVRLIDGQSGNEEIKDRINIVDDSCDYQMQIVVRPNTVVYNRALQGSFDYLVPLNSSGSAELSFIYGPERFNVNNTFWFAYQAVDIKSIDVKYINVFNRTEHEVKFSFVESNKEFNVTISYSENPAYRLGKSGEIRIGNKGNLYMLESSDKSSEEVIRDYLPVANRVSKMSFFIQSVSSNETVVIGSGNHEVIHNNPAYRSHLVGNGGENVYVIDSEADQVPEVIIHDVDEENSIDTIDLRNVVKKGNCELKVIEFENDLLLKATVKEQAEYCTVRLKDGVERYNKTHVILENVPMRISFDNNEWSLKPQPLMFERDKEIIVVTGQDVEEGSEIITPRKGGNYKFVRSNDNDLMITNAFDLTITKNDLCTITLSKFYETPRMKTLFIKFADKAIILKEHQEEISTARDVNVVKKEHKDQVYNDVFNRSPEVIMLSDQPVTHRHRHSRHREQARHRWSTTSSSTRPTGWINDLFGWVKSSVSGLLSSKPESTPSSISQVDARVDVNGTIMLLDMLIRKVTGQKYVSTADQSISQLEAQGYALNITKGFEKVVEQAGLKSGVSMHRLNIDYMGMQKEITRKVMSGKFNEISGILSSYVEKACPGKEAGYPGKLSEKRFNEFMAKFNKGLDVTLNQSIEHNGDGRLEVDGVKEQKTNSGPQSYLSNASVQGHLTQNKVKLIS